MAVILAASISAAPVQAQADRTLRIFPIPQALAPGESVTVGAFFCRTLPQGDVYGTDGIPNTDDDRCDPAKKARWSVEDAKVARVKPKRGARVELTGRRDGLTTLEAEFKATSTSTFRSRIPIDIAEPIDLPDTDGVDANGDDPAQAPAVDTTVVVQPGFAILAPGDEQLFAAFLCPVAAGFDPRGPDTLAGNGDDFCKPVDAMWSVLGDPPVGTIDPTQGHHTILKTDEEETALLASDGRAPAPRTAVGEKSGALTARVASGQEGGGSIGVDPGADRRPPFSPYDGDGDGDVDPEDLRLLVLLLGSTVGDPIYEPLADFNENGAIDISDLIILAANFSRT